MTATYDDFSQKAGFIGAILSDLELLADRESGNTECHTAAAMLHACQIMASRAQEIADAIQHDAMAAQKAEVSA